MLALGSRKYWTSNLKHFPYTLRSELETNRPLDSYDRFFWNFWLLYVGQFPFNACTSHLSGKSSSFDFKKYGKFWF